MLGDVGQQHDTIWLVSILHQGLSAVEYKSLSAWYDMTFSIFWTALLKAHHYIGWIDLKPYDQLSKSNETFNMIFSLPNILINHFTDILLQQISTYFTDTQK